MLLKKLNSWDGKPLDPLSEVRICLTRTAHLLLGLLLLSREVHSGQEGAVCLCGTSQPLNTLEKIVKIGLIKFSGERGNTQSEDFYQDDQKPLFQVKRPVF